MIGFFKFSGSRGVYSAPCSCVEHTQSQIHPRIPGCSLGFWVIGSRRDLSEHTRLMSVFLNFYPFDSFWWNHVPDGRRRLV